MGELKLNIYYKRLSVASKNTGAIPKEKTLKSLDSLTSVHEKLKFSEVYKSKHFKYLDFLRELHTKTKQRTLPGELSLTEIRNKHHVSPFTTKILIENHMLHEFGSGRGKTCYRWATIPPVMAMAEKLIQDVDKREVEKHNEKMVVINPEEESTPAPAPVLDIKKLVEQMLYHMPAPPDLNYTLVNQYIKQAVSEHVQALQGAMLAHLQQVMPQIVDTIIKSFPVPQALPAPEVQVVEIDKLTEKTVEHHHHHYITHEEKKSKFAQFFNKLKIQ